MGMKELPGKKRKKSKSSTDFQELGDDDMLALKKKQKVKSQEKDEDEIIVPKNDIKEMTKSIKELSEAMKILQEVLLTKVDLLEVSLKKEITKNEKFLCCFDCEEAKGNNSKTIFVKGFNNAKPRDEIKHELRNFFRSCGGVKRVFVPTECKTGVPLGFAFLDLINEEDNDKALDLNGSYMGGRKLKVKMAKHRDEFHGFPDFGGCDRCLWTPHNPPSNYTSWN